MQRGGGKMTRRRSEKVMQRKGETTMGETTMKGKQCERGDR